MEEAVVEYTYVKPAGFDTPKVVPVSCGQKNPEMVYDEQVLRQKSRVTSVEECKDLGIFEKLESVLHGDDIKGYGLSAIQIGYPICASYVEYKGEKICLVNPEITWKSEETYYLKGEGCLSFPNNYVTTRRYLKVRVKDDINGEREYEGWLSFVMQHEIDHLNGILYFDHAHDLTFRREIPKVGRNDACPCGSEKKYKKCCGK